MKIIIILVLTMKMSPRRMQDKGRLEMVNKVIPCCDRKDSTHPSEGTAISRFPSAISVILFPMDE